MLGWNLPPEECVTEPLASSDLGNQKRRSTRIVQAVPIVVTGVDALGQPFKERTTTVMVNCHGCKYQSKHYVPKNSIVKLEIPQLEQGAPPRTTPGRVVWVQRPRTVRELFQIGLEFEIAGNVWGIAFPPDDWFPLPSEEPAAAAPQAAARPAPPPVHYSAEPVIAEKPVETTATVKPAATAQPPSPPPPPVAKAPAAPVQPPAKQAAPPVAPAAPAAPAPPPSQPDQNKIHVVPSPAPSEESQVVLARHMARMVADAKEVLDKSLRNEAQTAVNEEMSVARQQLNVSLHDAVEKAIKVSMDRVSEATVRKVVQQAADRTAAIVDEARKATQSGTEQLDAKVRQAVQEAVSGAAEQAAQQAAQQTAALNLKDAVQQAVEKAISDRESATPSRQILSSPEAAQRHLDQWKKDLEDTAQGVRNQAVEQTQADAVAANRQWQEQFEAALKGASQKIGQELNEVSQAALSQVEQDIAARSSSLRASLDQAIAGAESTISTLGASLAEERSRTEVTKAELQDAARSALEQTRQKLSGTRRTCATS